MKSKMKKSMFYGLLFTPIVLGVLFLLGGYNALAAGPHGHGGPRGGMGARGGFGGGRGMYGPHHAGGFNWLGFLVFLIVLIAGVIFLVKWLKRKSSTSSMQQFIDTSFLSTPKTTINQNASMLDQWEKTTLTKKENE